MRKTLAIGFVLLSAALAGAQHHAVDYVLVGGSGSALLRRFTPPGSVVTLVPASAIPSTRVPVRGAMDVDNLSYVVGVNDNVRGAWILRIDRFLSISSIQLHDVPLFGPRIHDLIINQDGRYDVLMGPYQLANQPALVLEVDPASRTVTTAARLPGLVAPMSFARDLESGDHYILEGGTSVKADRLYRLAARGGALTSVMSLGPSVAFTRMQTTVDPASGDVYFTRATGLHRWRAGRGVSTVVSGTPYFSTQTLLADRTSAASPRLLGMIGSGLPASSRVYGLDLSTRAVTTLAVHPALTGAEDFMVHRGRSVSPFQVSPGRWHVLISLPNEPGRPYVAALGVSGTRPGVPYLGRRLPLNVDAITVLSVADRLRPYWTGGAGSLSATGQAVARLDVSQLPGTAGIRVWIQVVTLDGASPPNLMTIADPVLLLL